MWEVCELGVLMAMGSSLCAEVCSWGPLLSETPIKFGSLRVG